MRGEKPTLKWESEAGTKISPKSLHMKQLPAIMTELKILNFSPRNKELELAT